MTDIKLLSLSQGLATVKAIATEQKLTRLTQRSDKFQQRILSDLKDIGKSDNLENIIAAEKIIVKFDSQEYANSTNMRISLTTAQKELEAIETNIGLVGNPRRYKEIDISHAQPKVRDSRDLPLDGARIAFRSHNARLINYDKTKSDDSEKAIIQARRQNIKIAERLYIERQEKTLGRESGKRPSLQSKPQSRTMTKEQLEKVTAKFLADAQKRGANPQVLAAFQDVLKKALDQQAKKPSPEKNIMPKKPKSKNKDEPEIER
jgi:hypothetical protein